MVTQHSTQERNTLRKALCLSFECIDWKAPTKGTIFTASPYVLLKGRSLNQVPLMNWLIDQSEAVTVPVGGRRFYACSVTLDLADLVIEARAIYGLAHRLDLKGTMSRPFLGRLVLSSMFPPWRRKIIITKQIVAFPWLWPTIGNKNPNVSFHKGVFSAKEKR